MTGTVALWRPVGPKELERIEQSGMRAFPPRLPGQPIFYPVTSNVPESGSGFVTRFEVGRGVLADYRVEEAGGRAHREYRIPAEDVPAFHAASVGAIAATHRLPG